MRYHYNKPDIYKTLYGKTYECDHPVYSKCALYLMRKLGLAVIQQRYNPKTKQTWFVGVHKKHVVGVWKKILNG